MTNNNTRIDNQLIQKSIFTFRDSQIMLDRDLAEFYGVETKVLNQAVKRNIDRFPEKFRFQLSKQENDELLAHNASFKHLRSQSVTSNYQGGRRYLPYVFTEQGVSMLSAVLRSKTAIQVSIQIIDAFVSMRNFINQNATIFYRLDNFENKQRVTDTKLDEVFTAIDAGENSPKQGIFYDGQVFDAYLFICKLIKNAKSNIVLIDNYIDESVLLLLCKRRSKVTATIYTKRKSKVLQQDINKHNQQYPPITIKHFEKSHDRFLIIDNHVVYHIGASLKDLGKRWFAFSKIQLDVKEILNRLETENKGNKP